MSNSPNNVQIKTQQQQQQPSSPIISSPSNSSPTLHGIRNRLMNTSSGNINNSYLNNSNGNISLLPTSPLPTNISSPGTNTTNKSSTTANSIATTNNTTGSSNTTSSNTNTGTSATIASSSSSSTTPQSALNINIQQTNSSLPIQQQLSSIPSSPYQQQQQQQQQQHHNSNQQSPTTSPLQPIPINSNAPVRKKYKPLQRNNTANHDLTAFYGWIIIICTLAFFIITTYCLIFSKLLPDTGNRILDFIKYDWYYCLLIPALVPVTVATVYFNWLSLKFFRHN